MRFSASTGCMRPRRSSQLPYRSLRWPPMLPAPFSGLSGSWSGAGQFRLR